MRSWRCVRAEAARPPDRARGASGKRIRSLGRTSARPGRQTQRQPVRRARGWKRPDARERLGLVQPHDRRESFPPVATSSGGIPDLTAQAFGRAFHMKARMRMHSTPQPTME